MLLVRELMSHLLSVTLVLAVVWAKVHSRWATIRSPLATLLRRRTFTRRIDLAVRTP